MARLTKSIIEQAALAWLASKAYHIMPGLEIAPTEPAAAQIVGRCL